MAYSQEPSLSIAASSRASSAVLSLALLLAFVCSTAADTFGVGANQFVIDFVYIGQPGNDADLNGSPSPAGAVSYAYRIGKFEISRDIVDKVNLEGGLGITLHPMDFVFGGVRPGLPATGVSWNEAARFTNWLNASQGFPVAYKFASQPGEPGYDVNANLQPWSKDEPGFDAGNPFRNSRANYFLPNADEWYKAAYYDPASENYWAFTNGSNSPPTAVCQGSEQGTAVYLGCAPADVNQAGGLSPYGVMGLGGNVWEWEESAFNLEQELGSADRGNRGGFWSSIQESLSNSVRLASPPSTEYTNVGFRVASLPEPRSQLLALWGLLLLSSSRLRETDR